MSRLSVFGELLRAWRKRRGMSQLDLALSADTTSRYVSFVETGRSRPGRGVVLRLAAALHLPLRDQNALLRAAGLAAIFTEWRWDAPEMATARRVIDHILRQHEPFPAWVVAPGLRFIASNRAAERVMPGMTALRPAEIVDLWCRGTHSESRADAAAAVIGALKHELFTCPHPDIPALLQRAEAHLAAAGPAAERPFEPVVCRPTTFGDTTIETLATVLRFDKAADVTMAELRVELVFPADDAGDAFFRALAATDGEGER